MCFVGLRVHLCLTPLDLIWTLFCLMLVLPLLRIRFGLVSPSSRLYASRDSSQRATDQVVNLPARLDTSPQPLARFGLRSEYVCDTYPLDGGEDMKELVEEEEEDI